MSVSLFVIAQVVPTIFHALAIISTTVRLLLRYKSHRLWWDDAWAALSLAFDIAIFVPIWAVNYMTASEHSRVVVYWVILLSFNCDLWAARMSLIFAIIRIVPPTFSIQRIAHYTAAFIAVIWVCLVVQAIWHCGHNTSWYEQVPTFCPLTHSVLIVQLTVDLVSDGILVAIPLRLLWRAKLHKNHRRLLLLLFSASLLTTIVSVVRAIVILDESTTGLSEGIVTNVETAVSLIVCNSLVLGSYFYRIYRNGEDLESTVDYSGLVFDGFERAGACGRQSNRTDPGWELAPT